MMFDKYPILELSELDQMIFTYIRENPQLVSEMRVIDLAKAVHVSNSSIMRFIKKLKFKSFYEFKYVLKQSFYQTNQENVTSFRSVLDAYLSEKIFLDDFVPKLKKAAELIDQSQFVYCLGLGNSGVVAEYLSRTLASIGIKSYPIKESFSPYILTSVGQKNLILLVFSVSGETKEIFDIIDLKLFKKTQIISITQGKENSLATLSFLNIPYFTKKIPLHLGIDLSSQVPAVFISELLIKEILQSK